MPAQKHFIDGSKLQCSLCDSVKEAETGFNKSKVAKTGYYSQCKTCTQSKAKVFNKEARYFNKDGQLKCRECKEYKNVVEFHTDTTQKYRTFRAQCCKTCESLRKKEARLAGYEDNVVKVLASVYNGINTRSGSNHEMTRGYLLELYNKQLGKCAISGIEMTAKRGKGRFPYNISADQITPGGGYTKENVQLVCSQVNMMKGTLPLTELVLICSKIVEKAANENRE